MTHSTSNIRLVIAMGGRAQSGKTRLIRSLEEHLTKHGYSVEVLSFAEPVKTMLATLGLKAEHLYGSEKETPSELLGGATPRFAMQSLATGWGREMLYDDIWVDAWKRRVSKSHAGVILVDDLRHVPELLALRQLGAIIHEVYRPAKEPRGFVAKLKTRWKKIHAHPSERFDFQKNGVDRFVVEEGPPEDALKKFLAAYPFLF